jgi:hypothetical protein
VRSASAFCIVLVLLATTALVALTGCDTTQDKAARLKIRSARTLASRHVTRVGEPAHAVKVLSAALLAGKDESAIAVELRNDGDEPVNDLPLLVGVEGRDGKREYLNADRDVAYFKAHTAGLGPGEDGVWVYTSRHELDPSATAFAEVGDGPVPPLPAAASLPEVDLGAPSHSGSDPGRVEVEVSNELGFPQYDLTVFAWATRDGRLVAAGRASAGDLEAGEVEPVTLKLIGDPKDAELHISAPPTIYQ